MSDLEELDDSFGERVGFPRGKFRNLPNHVRQRECSYQFPDKTKCRAMATSSSGGHYCRHHEPKVNLP